jgi:molecular chaperone GrpE
MPVIDDLPASFTPESEEGAPVRPYAYGAAQPASQPASQDPSGGYREPPGEPAGSTGPGGFTTERQAALRALRNLEATEARLERNAKREAEETRGKLVQELLPVLDNLDRTIRAAQTAQVSDRAMLEGVRLIRHQLEGVLRGYGVERIDAVDLPFDPSQHEAIGVVAVADAKRHGVVVEQAEAGYRLAGKLLRPAKVSVGKLVAPAEPAPRPLWR